MAKWVVRSFPGNNWRCASFDSMTPANKTVRSVVYFLRRQPWKFDIVTLVARWRVYFPVFFGDFVSPFIFTKTSRLSVNQFQMWRNVGTNIQIYIFTSTDLHVWYQHVDQSFNDVTNRILDLYAYSSIDILVHFHIYISICQYVNMYMHTHICVNVYTYIYLCIYIYVYIYTGIYTYIPMYI